ncbi:MAG: alpha/beta fold hydrolase [Actinomycetota bacterium]
MSERPRRRWPRRLLTGVLAFIVLFYAGGGLYFSQVIDERALDGAALRKTLDPRYDLVVRDVAGEAITITPDGEHGSLTQEGVFGLRWEGGYGQVSTILGTDGDAVIRRFLLISGGPPSDGTPAQLEVRAWPDPESAGLASQDVTVPGPLGKYPAWFVPSHRDTWVIDVHGNSMSRLDGLRLVPITVGAGFPTLVPTYRNDVGAPEDPSGKLRYGLTEWHDLESAVRYALHQGATDVVLAGYSMGGGVVMAFLERSQLRDAVRGVILDAPMLDFSATVDDNASREEVAPGVPLPSSLTAVAKQIAAWRFGIEWDQLNYLANGAKRYDVPFLIFHGTADTTVPIATSERFADLRPDIVTLVRCADAEHIACWNLDPAAYSSAVTGFLHDEL